MHGAGGLVLVVQCGGGGSGGWVMEGGGVGRCRVHPHLLTTVLHPPLLEKGFTNRGVIIRCDELHCPLLC